MTSDKKLQYMETPDITSRMDQLSRLQAGWLNGQGVALDIRGVQWFRQWINLLVAERIPIPHLYPTPEGGLRVEWMFGRNDVSLEVNLKDQSANWHLLNLDTDQEEEQNLLLTDSSVTAWLKNRLLQLDRGDAWATTHICSDKFIPHF